MSSAPSAAAPLRHRTVISDADLRSLPDDLQVDGDLELQNCPRLEGLPTGLRVSGDLVIRGCARLRDLPTTMHVGGALKILGRTRLSVFPAGLQIGGDIVLHRAVSSISPGLQTHGNLAILRCPELARLPDGLSIGGDLILRRTGLKMLPSGLNVRGGIELRFAQIASIPADLSVGDYLDLEACQQLESLPLGLHVPGWLRVARCVRLRRVPAMTVGFSGEAPKLAARWTWNHLERPGRPRMAPGSLNLENCRSLEELEDGLRVSSTIEVAGTLLKATPNSCRDARLQWRGVEVPPRVAFEPQALDETDIFNAPNMELRRVMLQRIGMERFFHLVQRQGTVEVIEADADRGGPRRLLRLSLFRAGVETCLECRCPSTGRLYLLRVPPRMRSCHQAAAWIAGFDDPTQYQPIIET